MSDPLKPETRKARLYLLGISMVGITIVYTGLVPQQITTLGITFGEADRRSLLFILALVILYFLAAFVVYGGSDFLASRTAFARVRWSDLQAEARRWEETQWEETQRRIHGEEPLRESVEDRKYREQRDMEYIVARFDEQERRVEERLAAGLMSKEEAVKKVIEEMDQEEDKVAADAILAAAKGETRLDDQQKSLDDQKRIRKLEERVAAGLMSREEAAKEIAGLKRRQSQRVADKILAVATVSPQPFDYAQSWKAERVFRRYAALSPKMWYIRSLFEFLLPILLGLYAIYALVAG